MSTAQNSNVKQKKRVKKNVTNITNLNNKPQTMVYKVPHCAEHYFDCLIDPFSTDAGVCIPCDLFPLPSQKIKMFMRGTFALGTTGLGFIYCTPPVNNQNASVFTTTAASVGTASTILATFTNTQTLTFDALPYDQAALSGGNVRARLVGYGLRVKYVGPLMSQQGMCFALEEPDHLDIGSTMTINSFSQYQYTRAERVGQMKDWDSTVCYSGPVAPGELEFSHVNTFAGGANFIGIAISGGVGDKFEFEIVEHLEYAGTRVPSRTPSHADAQAFGKVVETVKNATANQPLQPSMARPLWERFKSSLVEGLPRLASGVVQVVSSAFNGDLSKLMSGSQDLYKGVQPTVRALLENPASRGYLAGPNGSPFSQRPVPVLLLK